jgi:hypothetical protein
MRLDHRDRERTARGQLDLDRPAHDRPVIALGRTDKAWAMRAIGRAPHFDDPARRQAAGQSGRLARDRRPPSAHTFRSAHAPT